MSSPLSQRSDADRAVSVAVTHVLAIGVTVILIGVLFVGVGDLVDLQTERSADSALETIGERLAGEVDSAARLDGTVWAEHPTRVSGMLYRVELVDGCSGYDPPLIDGDTDCLRLMTGEGTEVFVPLSLEGGVNEGGPVAGGTIRIDATGSDVSIEEVP